MLRVDVLTLFPEMIAPVLGQSILKRAQEKGLLDVHVRNLRDFTTDRHKVADDIPYGGGAGMVMKAEPILQAVDILRAEAQAHGEDIRLLFPSPHGRPFTQQYAKDLSTETRRIVILCGHYEGVDERVRIALSPEEVSAGDYVLTGGELPALVLIDAAARLVPGVLGIPSPWSRNHSRMRSLNIRSTRGRPRSAAWESQRCCYPAITKPSGCGGGSRRCEVPICAGPI